MIKKYISLAIILLFTTSMINAQKWTEKLPAGKNKKDLTLKDYKDAFDEYWAPFNVEKGYYLENGEKKKAIGWKQFERWYYNMEGQVNPKDGSFPTKTAQQIFDEYIRDHPYQKGETTANWTVLGPNYSDGGYAGVGRINTIAFHPSNNNIYWVGAPSGGLWMTSNNGGSWTCLTDDNNVLGVSDIAIPSDYTSSQTIYIATGDRDAWDNRSIGVLKSTDGGASWSTTGLQFDLSDSDMTTRMLMDPNDDETIIAATSNGVFKTTNGGATWSNQLTSLSFIDMEYKPGDFNTIYGSTTYGEVWRTTDGGNNWNKVLDDGYRIELAVTPANSSYVYAIVVDGSDGLEAIYRSSNSGGSFSEVFSGGTSNLLEWGVDGTENGGQGWYDLSLAVSPTNANTVLVGGINTWRSTNGGSSWSLVNHWYGGGGVQEVHADKHQLKYRNNGDLFECNDGGVYISSDDGLSWVDKTNGMEISQIYKLSVSQTVADETIIGLQDNGTKLLNGGSWDDVKSGDGMECLIDYTDVNTQYGTYTYGQISRTTNHWFSSVDIEPSGAGYGAWVTPYIISPTNNSTLYAGYADVWKTTNKGNSWTKISTFNTSSKIRAMAIAPSNTQVLFVSDPDQIWKTTNDGGSWTDVTNNLPIWSSSITYIAIKNDDPNTIWVTLSGYNGNNVYQSTNGGSSWTNISDGLPELPAYTIVQNTQIASTTHLYVGTELGVFFKNGSNNWVQYNDGLPNVKCGELEIYYATNPANSKLRLASYGRGLWETFVEQENSDLASVQTTTPTDITSSTATLGGNVTDEGSSNVTERGVVWSTFPNPTTGDNKIIDGGTGTGSYTAPLTGLSSATTYYARAYAVNNSGTAYGGQEDFTTNCSTFSLPFSEDFEGASFPPNCWETFIGDNGIGTNKNWESTEDAQSGSKAAFVGYEDVTGGDAEDWMVTPLISLTTGSELSFYQKQTYSEEYGSEYFIFVSTSSQTDISSFTVVESWGESDFTTSYSEKIVDLSAFDNQDVYIAFAMVNDNGDDWFVDNINITGSSNPTPVATVVATPGCTTGSVIVSSDLSGTQTFYLTDDSGNELDDVTVDATSYEFTGIADGIYRGKVERNGQMSNLSSSVTLTNNTVPDQPGAISGEINPCEGDSETYSVTNDPEATSYIWSLPSGWSGSSSTNSINVNVGITNGAISVVPVNSCGNGPSQSLNVAVSTIPPQPTAIEGNTEVCEGTQETYSVTNDSDVDSYLWTLPGGWSGNSTTNEITVTVGSNNGDITVTPSNDCGTGSFQSLAAVVSNSGPVQPDPIEGDLTVCVGNIETYSVPNDAAVDTYTWSLPSGWVGSSTTNEITVTVGENDGEISVVPNNQCGIGEAQVANVEVSVSVPSQPSVIIGSVDACENSNEIYSVDFVEDVDYNWTLPSDWSGNSTSNTISVTIGSESGEVLVVPENNCGFGESQSLMVNVSSIPDQPEVIDGNPEVCEGTQETYSVPNDPNVDSYTWSIPAAWTGSSTSNSITVTVGSSDGDISVIPTNECGTGPLQTLAVVVTNSGPQQPEPIEGDFTVCSGNTETYSVPNDPSVDTYTWSLPSGWTGNSTTNEITAVVGENGGEISVVPSNQCGVGSAQTVVVEVSSQLPDQPSAISGSVNPCESSTEIYSVDLEDGINYTWLLPSAWAGASNTNEIVVNVGNSNGVIEVIPANGCGAGSSQTLAVTVNTTPDQAGEILGEASPCEGAEIVYSVSPQLDVTFNWILPIGWTGNSSTNEITVIVGNSEGNISVTTSNECGESPSSTIIVDPIEILDDLGAITGSSLVMETETALFSVNAATDADTYIWTLASNWEIQGIDNGNEVSINFPLEAESGILSVKAENACGESNPSNMTIEIMPIAISEVELGSIQIYPNPAQEILNIQLEKILIKDASLFVYDLNGKRIYAEKLQAGSKNIQLNVENYTKGSYYIELKTNYNSYKYKVVIQ